VKGKKILIVDDDKAILESFKGVLESEGAEVETAETASEALDATGSRSFNLALLDIKLPDMEGTELLSKIHGDQPGMMKVMVTGHPTLENAARSLNMGADAYVMKPVNPEDLLKVVKEKLEEQGEAEAMGKGKMAEWLQIRLKKSEKADE
jgi:DNA-binding NtrC family response regulator